MEILLKWRRILLYNVRRVKKGKLVLMAFSMAGIGYYFALY